MTDPKPQHPEVGRTLKASELKPKTIVWLHKANRKAVATMWVVGVHQDFVEFYSGERSIAFLAMRKGDEITDSTGEQFAVYEYLGKP